jgi:4'-phosphopantetheinyl transferase EntD
VDSRRLEFTTARACARRALQALGLTPTPILRGHHREPLWPPGVVGSITHCAGYRAAAAALNSHMLCIGIDAEVHESLPAGVMQRVSLPQERAWLAMAPPEVCWDRVLFSAKESIYKAWFPLTQRPLGFEDASVCFQPLAGTFRVELRTELPIDLAHALEAFSGRFLVRNGLVLTAIALPQVQIAP